MCVGPGWKGSHIPAWYSLQNSLSLHEKEAASSKEGATGKRLGGHKGSTDVSIIEVISTVVGEPGVGSVQVTETLYSHRDKYSMSPGHHQAASREVRFTDEVDMG